MGKTCIAECICCLEVCIFPGAGQKCQQQAAGFPPLEHKPLKVQAAEGPKKIYFAQNCGWPAAACAAGDIKAVPRTSPSARQPAPEAKRSPGFVQKGAFLKGGRINLPWKINLNHFSGNVKFNPPVSRRLFALPAFHTRCLKYGRIIFTGRHLYRRRNYFPFQSHNFAPVYQRVKKISLRNYKNAGVKNENAN